MAVETLILRPTYTNAGSAQCHPDTTEAESRHLLVAEEIPDGDATYIENNVAVAMASCGFYFTAPTSHLAKNPYAARIVVCAKAVVAESILNTNIEDGNSNGTANTNKGNSCALTEEYATYSIEVPSDYVSGLWASILTITDGNGGSGHILFSTTLPTSGGSKASAGRSRITQLYLELDFEAEDTFTPEVHVKRNGTWLGVTQQFQKVNGAWVEITTDEAKEILANNAVEVTS